MISLQAISVSSGAKEMQEPGFSGRLHSVFRRAANVLSGDRLLTISDIRLGDLPNALIVRLEEAQGFADVGIMAGMEIRGDGGRLGVPESDLSITLAGATATAAKKRIEGGVLPLSERAANLKRARELGAILAPDEGLGPIWYHVDAVLQATPDGGTTWSPLCRAAIGPLASLATGLRSGDEMLVGQGSRRLAGLGIGLTPSGDDLLTGLAGALSLLGDSRQTGDAIPPTLQAILAAADGRTNLVAWTYLRHAVRGEISAVLADYVSAVAGGREGDIDRASQSLFAVGGTSGAELALGAFLGLCFV